jgi:glutamate-1-semialdehyde 2,1-aminomutase
MAVGQALAAIDRARLRELQHREESLFHERRPRSRQLLERARRSLIKGVPMSWMWGLYRHPPPFIAAGRGASFEDIDGNRYLDFNLGDLALTAGFGHPAIVAAVEQAMRRGAHFLLPVEEAIAVGEELARRTELPFWQFTLSASGANAEVVRIARALTGRQKIAVFDGHYHGHLDATLVERHDAGVVPSMTGLAAGVERDTLILPFNDLAAAERALHSREVAVVLTEPALTNCTLVLPQPGFLSELHRVCRERGTLLCLDEAHSFQFAFGGLARGWSAPCDFLVLGKGLGTGVPFGLYGMSAAVADYVGAHTYADMGPPGLATGGTTYGSPLAVLTAQAALEQVLTEENYRRVAALGTRLAEGLQHAFNAVRLPWRALCLGPRSGYCLFPELPRNGAEAARSIDLELIAARRLYFANRGLWDAIASAGPQVSFAHSAGDVDAYVGVAQEFLREVVAH